VGLKSGVDFEHFFFGQGGSRPGLLRSQLFFEVLGPTPDLSPTFFASRRLLGFFRLIFFWATDSAKKMNDERENV
jgi:hypothetical protein